jgi:hypothetical protein
MKLALAIASADVVKTFAVGLVFVLGLIIFLSGFWVPDHSHAVLQCFVGGMIAVFSGLYFFYPWLLSNK